MKKVLIRLPQDIGSILALVKELNLPDDTMLYGSLNMFDLQVYLVLLEPEKVDTILERLIGDSVDLSDL